MYPIFFKEDNRNGYHKLHLHHLERTLYRKLNAEYVAVKNCSREFEGSILGQGSTVKVLGVGDITVSDYAKNTDMTFPLRPHRQRPLADH